jgi:uncharacterized protein YdiU (UPF0061 family)
MILNTAMDVPEAGWRFDNTYARLPQQFYTRTTPTAVRLPAMALFNRSLAEAMGLKLDIRSGD